ncbi:hypothetical protein BJ742DRAFT_790435 [Cladochytrium replicatum]|nr:hypothetical protein BJ742DRAFT_790435 [Cladochytrium replicatum]
MGQSPSLVDSLSIDLNVPPSSQSSPSHKHDQLTSDSSAEVSRSKLISGLQPSSLSDFSLARTSPRIVEPLANVAQYANSVGDTIRNTHSADPPAEQPYNFQWIGQNRALPLSSPSRPILPRLNAVGSVPPQQQLFAPSMTRVKHSAQTTTTSTETAPKLGAHNESHLSEENALHIKGSTRFSNASTSQSQVASTDNIRLSDNFWPQHVPLPAEQPYTLANRAEHGTLKAPNWSQPTESIRSGASLFNVTSVNRGVQGAAVWNARTIRPVPKKKVKPVVQLGASKQHVAPGTFHFGQLSTSDSNLHYTIDSLQRSLISHGGEEEAYSVSPRCHATAADRNVLVAEPIVDSCDEHSETSEASNFGRYVSVHQAREDFAAGSSTDYSSGLRLMGNQKKKKRLSSLGAPLSTSDQADSADQQYQSKGFQPVPPSTVPESGLPAIFGTNTSYALDRSTASIITATAAATCVNTSTVEAQSGSTVSVLTDGPSVLSSGEYFSTNRVIAMNKSKLANMAALDPFSFTFGDKNWQMKPLQRGTTGSGGLSAIPDDDAGPPEPAKHMISEMPVLVDDDVIVKEKFSSSAEKRVSTTQSAKCNPAVRVNNKKKKNRKSGREVLVSPGKPSEESKAKKGEAIRRKSAKANPPQEKENIASDGAKKGRAAFLDSFSKPLIPYRYRRARFRAGFREDDWMCFFCEYEQVFDGNFWYRRPKKPTNIAEGRQQTHEQGPPSLGDRTEKSVDQRGPQAAPAVQRPPLDQKHRGRVRK